MKKISLIILSLLFLLGISDAMLSTTSQYNSRHWLQNSDGTFYANRKEVTITGSTAGAQTDYQIPLNISRYKTSMSSNTGASATSYWGGNPNPALQNAFYAVNRHWKFYNTSDSGNYSFITSTDGGATWSSPTVVVASSGAADRWGWALAADGTTIHYVRNGDELGEGAFYRMGTLVSDGTISWAAVEQTVLSGAANYFPHDITIVVDSSGYPYIGYGYSHFLGGANYEGWAYVTKSSTKDGTWTTAATYPYKFTNTVYTTDTSYILTNWVILAALTNDRIYAISAGGSDTDGVETIAEGALFNGSTWGASEAVTPDMAYGAAFGMAVESDDIHLLYYSFTDTTYNYLKYTYGSGWGTPVDNLTGNNGQPVLVYDPSISTVYVLWMETISSKIYIRYKTLTNGTWSTAKDWHYEPAAMDAQQLGVTNAALLNGKLAMWYTVVAAVKTHRFVTEDTNANSVGLEGNIQADFDDIRVVPNTRLVETPLSDWKETMAGSQIVKNWVKIPSIPDNTGTVKVYVYYGNASATTASSGANTMLFYDGFETDLSAWTITQTTAQASVQSSVTFAGTQALLIDDNDNAQYVSMQKDVGATGPLRFGYTFRTNQPYSSTSTRYDYGIAGNKYHQTRINGTTLETSYNGSTFTTLSTVSDDTWYKFMATVDGTTSTFYLDGVLTGSGSVLSSVQTSKIIAQSFNATKGRFYLDDVFISKYISPEPSTSWGSQVSR